MKVTSLVLLASLLGGVGAIRMAARMQDQWASKTQNGKPSDLPMPSKESGQPVFYAIVMGPVVAKHETNTWLASLRKVGNFKGTAVIVTDRAECLAQNLKETKLLGRKLRSSDKV